MPVTISNVAVVALFGLALLLPGLIYAADPSAPLTVNVVPGPTVTAVVFPTNPQSVADNISISPPTQVTPFTVTTASGTYQGQPAVSACSQSNGAPSPQANCPFAVFGTPGNWSLETTPTASGLVDVSGATLTVTAPPATGVHVLQYASWGNNINGMTFGTNQCTWTMPHAITTGSTIVGFMHSFSNPYGTPIYPTSITDNAGNNYTLTPVVQWQPWAEDILTFYKTNVTGGATTFAAHFSANPGCNAGVTEFSGVSAVNAVINPTLLGGTSPAITITPTVPSVIWAFAADYDQNLPYTSDPASILTTTGYVRQMDSWYYDNIMTWQSLGLMSGSQTLTWTAPLGSSCPYSSNGCPTMLAALALTPSAPVASQGSPVNGTLTYSLAPPAKTAVPTAISPTNGTNRLRPTCELGGGRLRPTCGLGGE